LATQRLSRRASSRARIRDSADGVFQALCCGQLYSREYSPAHHRSNEQLTSSPCTRRGLPRHCTRAPRDPAGASRRGLEPISAGHSLWAHARRLPRSCKARISISSALKSTAQRLRTRRPSCTGIASPPPTRGHRRSRRRRGRAITGQPRICCCTRERWSLWVSNSLSGSNWELDEVRTVGNPTHVAQIGRGHRVSTAARQRRVTLQ